MRMTDLKPGWEVVANDGHRIGKVREVGQHYIGVSGGHFSTPIYIPASAIANVEHQTVHLNLAGGEVDAMGWQQPPRSADDLQTDRERAAPAHLIGRQSRATALSVIRSRGHRPSLSWTIRAPERYDPDALERE